jgi:hypothetical protein
MAFIPEEEEDSNESGMNVLSGQDQQQEQQNQQQVAGAIGGTGTSQSPVNLGSQAAPVAQAPQTSGTRKQKGSGMFTDIRKYIQANQGATEGIADAVKGKMGQQAADIRNQIEKQQSKFNRSLEQNQANLQSSRQFAQEAVQTAGSGQLQEPDFTRYQSFLTNPGQFDVAQPVDMMKQRSRARALESLARRSQRAEGREDLLRETFGKGRLYTRGQRAVDSLLLSADPETSGRLGTEAAQQLSGIPENIAAARRKALQGISGIRKNIAEFTGQQGEAAQQVVGQAGARTQLEEQLQSAAAAELQRMTTRRGELLEKLNNRRFLTPDEFKELGVAEKLQGTLQGFLTATSGAPQQVNFGQYLDVLDPKRFTKETIASPEQRARYDALSRLVGREGLGEGEQAGLRFNADAAIRDVLSRMGHDDVQVTEEGLTGNLDRLNQISQDMLAFNPYLAASLMAIDPVTQTVDPLLAPVGISTGDAVSGTMDIADQQVGALQNAGKFVTSGFDFDQAAGIIDAQGNTIMSAADVAKAITPNVGGGDTGQVLAALASGGHTAAISAGQKAVQAAAQRAAAAASRAARAVRRIFCFTGDTLVRMYDGTVKKLSDIKLGDELWLGGQVEGIGQAYCGGNVYEYKGAYVSGSHAVFEEGTWTRVENSKYATMTALPIETVVYPMTCENHLMVVNDFISADFSETDESWDNNEQERLDALNSDIDRNRWLIEEEFKLKGGQ